MGLVDIVEEVINYMRMRIFFQSYSLYLKTVLMVVYIFSVGTIIDQTTGLARS
jgi:hypothetical protein